jgi:hypothetical protein
MSSPRNSCDRSCKRLSTVKLRRARNPNSQLRLFKIQ